MPITIDTDRSTISTATPDPLAGLLLARVFDAVVCVDSASRIVVFNPAAERMLGHRANDVLGRPLQSLPSRNGQTSDLASLWRHAHTANGRLRTCEPDEVTLVHRDGSRLVVEIDAASIEAGGEAFVALFLRDRTAERRADERDRLVRQMTLAIAAAPDLGEALFLSLQTVGGFTGWTAGEVWLPGAAGTVLKRGPVWSTRPDLETFHSASEEFAFGPGQGLPGQVWQAARPMWIEDITTDPDFMRKGLAREHGLRTGVGIPVLAADEVVAVIVFYHDRICDRDRDMVELVSVIAAQLGTLVQRRQTEEALRRHAEELARSNADLEQFAYVASHDLQEPLRMVASYTQLLARRYGDRLDGDAHEFIGFAVEGVTRMQQLIHDLLSFSRIGTRGESFVPISLEALVERVLRDMEPQLEAAGAIVEVGPLPRVAGDSAQLYQVFQNLIDNAVKFRGSEPPRIRIGATGEEGWWVISVEDNGIGIEADYHDRIFSIFQRLHTRAEYPGTGIGLAICKKVVERHGGRIWVESQPGAGTRFCFRLPAAAPDDDAAPGPQP
jgi:PAS domain S-box-containing protein